MLFPCPIHVNNSLLPTRVFTSVRIKTVEFRMILIYDVVFGLVFKEQMLLTDRCQSFKNEVGVTETGPNQYL